MKLIDRTGRSGLAQWVFAMAVFLCSGVVHAASVCGSPRDAGGYGPYDYRTNKDKLKMVEDFHFTPEVETLRHGKTGLVGGDLSYTLTVFPNHHRALMSFVNLVFKEKKAQPDGAHFTVDCYFERAETFTPDDPMVKVIHGIYLIRAKKPKDAVAILEEAAAIAGDDPNVNYNLALGLIDVGRADEAVKYAQVAYAAGFPLPGLKNKLKALGKWKEPDTVAPAPSAAK